MVEYATLGELESTALQYRDDLLGENKGMTAVAARIGKPLRPWNELDGIVFRAINGSTSPFQLQIIPRLWRDLIETYLPEENVDLWLDDKKAIDGSSPREKLSALNPTDLKSGVDTVAGVLYEVLAFATVPALPSTAQLLYVTRLAQAEQLGNL